MQRFFPLLVCAIISCSQSRTTTEEPARDDGPRPGVVRVAPPKKKDEPAAQPDIQRVVTEDAKKEPPKEKAKTPAVKEEKKDDLKAGRAERLRKADAEAMELFRRGKKQEGINVLEVVIVPYKELTPADCTPEEALGVAIIYARALKLMAESVTKEQGAKYAEYIRIYSERGGIDPRDYLAWMKKMGEETAAAWNAGNKNR